MPHAAVVLDNARSVVVANRAAARLFRVVPDRLRGAAVATLMPQANVEALLRKVGERPITMEIARGGGAGTLKLTAARLAAGGRTVSGGGFTLLIIEDISDKGALEQQLVDTEKQAAIGQLAAGILHEIANPLTGIGSNLVFVQSALPPHVAPAVRQAVDLCLEQVDQMRRLLGTLSGLPRRPPLRCERTNLEDVLRTCLSFVAREAERRRVDIVSRLDPTIACDIDVRITKQVVLNLLKNAIEAMPDGGRILVSTSSLQGDALRPPAAIIAITDSGVGIPDADLRKVFRPLFSTKPRGAGLGLSFCRQAVEEHGGEIRLSSRGQGQGTTAIVTIPLRQVETPED